MQRIIIVNSRNLTPEDEVNARIEELGEGWRIVAANTSLALQGTMDTNIPEKAFGVANHVYYVTTVVLEKTS